MHNIGYMGKMRYEIRSDVENVEKVSQYLPSSTK